MIFEWYWTVLLTALCVNSFNALIMALRDEYYISEKVSIALICPGVFILRGLKWLVKRIRVYCRLKDFFQEQGISFGAFIFGKRGKL